MGKKHGHHILDLRSPFSASRRFRKNLFARPGHHSTGSTPQSSTDCLSSTAMAVTHSYVRPPQQWQSPTATFGLHSNGSHPQLRSASTAMAVHHSPPLIVCPPQQWQYTTVLH
ncbi:hypothetical protein RRG08_019177 [Elysia crispata]|uniref:Uncharacterized protein n=1 Tax=Elysia crispata TaxID=231223 RepID=A0AAE0ZWR3_9GAST|nr:hypothetical protein RRG08_019177 [Elysia crispata]